MGLLTSRVVAALANRVLCARHLVTPICPNTLDTKLDSNDAHTPVVSCILPWTLTRRNHRLPLYLCRHLYLRLMAVNGGPHRAVRGQRDLILHPIGTPVAELQEELVNPLCGNLALAARLTKNERPASAPVTRSAPAGTIVSAGANPSNAACT